MILDNWIFTEMVLPFLLIFVLVFAILQKSKILGDGKAQIDALISLVIGLILVVFPQPRAIVVGIMPWLAVGLAVLLVFFLLYGFVAGDLSKSMPLGLKIAFGILAGIFVIGVVAYVSGLWTIFSDWFNATGSAGDIITTIIFIVIIAGAFIIAIFSGKKKDKDS